MAKKKTRDNGLTVMAVYKCPCCDEKMEKEIFIGFDDPCICNSGEKFKDCCCPEIDKEQSKKL
jgi:hypothetical protein